jgi:predicted RNA-binding protein YlxR (DUF448 family)
MTAKPVHISLARDPKTKKQGRSAFIRDAAELYLATKRRRDMDRQIATAYEGKSHELLADTEPWIEEQAWPKK